MCLTKYKQLLNDHIHFLKWMICKIASVSFTENQEIFMEGAL